MLELWRRSFELSRRHLVLWLPCTCAALLNLALARLERSAVISVARWMSTQHSVLGGETVSTDPAEFQHRALMVAMPLGLCRQFIEVCLFVAALMTTAKLIRRILNEQRPEIDAASKEIVPEWRGMLLFSLKFMLATGAMTAILSFAMSSASISGRLGAIVASKVFIYTVGLAMEAGVAWLLTPAAMRLLGALGDAYISNACRRLGAILMVLASAAALVVENIVGRLEKGLVFDLPWDYSAVSVLNTIIVNMPEVLFFIALSLLAATVFPGRDETRPTWNRGLLRRLMPMHFEEGKTE